jgi:hypothetical protein
MDLFEAMFEQAKASIISELKADPEVPSDFIQEADDMMCAAWQADHQMIEQSQEAVITLLDRAVSYAWEGFEFDRQLRQEHARREKEHQAALDQANGAYELISISDFLEERGLKLKRHEKGLIGRKVKAECKKLGRLTGWVDSDIDWIVAYPDDLIEKHLPASASSQLSDEVKNDS